MSCAADDLNPPCLEALVAGTVALMSCWAAPLEGGSSSPRQQRTAMAHERWILASDANSDASVVTPPDPALADPMGLLPTSTLMH